MTTQDDSCEYDPCGSSSPPLKCTPGMRTATEGGASPSVLRPGGHPSACPLARRSQRRCLGHQWPRCNTVQLREDGDEGWAVGLGPECVADAFDVPADVFAFDDPWVGAEPSGRVEPVGEPADCLGPAAFSVLRGESRPVGRWWHERC